MRTLLLVLLAATAWTAWYWSRFPGRWIFTFSAKYADERAQLADCRRNLREVNKTAARTEKSARDRANAEETKYQQDIQALEHEIEGLLHPGLGRHLKGPIGKITLYEHGAKVAGRTKPIPLAGLQVQFRSGPNHVIDLVEPSRRIHRAKYPLRRPPDNEETPFFTEEQLSDFARSPPQGGPRRAGSPARSMAGTHWETPPAVGEPTGRSLRGPGTGPASTGA
ncbi:hypothetical protein ACFYXM_34470 [Streptomyces sp. NPDC002476]|uniref:hypothetical protein n=1 Tax=Streptomyces sp. NPDC002476 TaxID=3364648 RepID=UPI0036AA5F8E